ncbi:restriction endonuclease subunit S [Staphylococcus saprophyticus]|uniref:restriction endonuclease subunit S n=1 Tax=Staphylococcus saprophyticus TaxID=29385 RepID=UPI00374EA643
MTNEIKNVPELRFPEFKEEWSKLKLGELAEIVRGSSPRPISDPRWFDINSDIGWLRISDVTEQNGKITKLEQKISKDGQKKTRVLHSKHLLLSIAATVGKPVINYVKTGVHDGFLIFLRPLFDIEFMYQWLDAYRPKWKKYGQPGSQVNLNSELVKSQKIYMPHSVEQKKISDFFSKLDQQIELEEQKLEKLEEQKKGYMQKLFSQEIRFKDNKGNNYPDWKIVEIGGILEERTERSGEGDMLSVTINNGIIKFDEIDRKDNSSKDKSNYRKVYKDDIAYNSMRMWQGASGKSEYEGIVSPAYTVTIPSENINPDFIAYYFKTHKMIHKFKINSQGLTSDTWNLKYRQLKDIKLNLCSKEEQNKIANLLIMYDKLINKQKHKVEILKTNKKGFLQKMFI